MSLALVTLVYLSGCQPEKLMVDCSSQQSQNVIDGPIDSGLEDCKFEFDEAITLTSKGGYYSAAVNLSNRVKLFNTDTTVRHYCASACTFIALSGSHRKICDNATLGFHQPDDVSYIDEVIDFYHADDRIDPAVISAIIQSTPNNSIHIVLPEDALRFGMADEIIDCN